MHDLQEDRSVCMLYFLYSIIEYGGSRKPLMYRAERPMICLLWVPTYLWGGAADRRQILEAPSGFHILFPFTLSIFSAVLRHLYCLKYHLLDSYSHVRRPRNASIVPRMAVLEKNPKSKMLDDFPGMLREPGGKTAHRTKRIKNETSFIQLWSNAAFKTPRLQSEQLGL